MKHKQHYPGFEPSLPWRKSITPQTLLCQVHQWGWFFNIECFKGREGLYKFKFVEWRDSHQPPKKQPKNKCNLLPIYMRRLDSVSSCRHCIRNKWLWWDYFINGDESKTLQRTSQPLTQMTFHSWLPEKLAQPAVGTVNKMGKKNNGYG